LRARYAKEHRHRAAQRPPTSSESTSSMTILLLSLVGRPDWCGSAPFAGVVARCITCAALIRLLTRSRTRKRKRSDKLTLGRQGDDAEEKRARRVRPAAARAA
jgi:hypothetical protein